MKVCTGCQRDDSVVSFEPHHNQCHSCRKHSKKDNHTIKLVRDTGDALAAFGTEIEKACVEACARLGSVQAAADELKLDRHQLRAHLGELQRKAARRGYSPAADMVKTTPEGFHVKGVSSYYKVGPDGTRELAGQWVKTKADEELHELAMLDAMTHVADAWQGKAEPIAVPTHADEDLMCVYPMGDPHLGMYAWEAECGQNHTLAAAERNLVAAVDHLVDLAPPAKTGLVLNLGDYFHFDNERGETTLGTRQDVDTRLAKVAAVGIRTMRRCIDQALTKHELVIERNVPGNHDRLMAMMLSLCLAQFYEREPRVQIDTSPSSYWFHRFGDVLVGAAHGDLCKLEQLMHVMAVDRARDWGETTYRYFYAGHVHHDSVKELPGVTVETFRTLAPKDKWAFDKAYRAGQDMKLDILHRRWGRIQRHIVGIERLVEKGNT